MARIAVRWHDAFDSGLGITTQNNAAVNPTCRIGAKNTTNTFAGVIRDDAKTSIIKVGTGSLILLGQNTYSGSTIVSNGVLALTTGVSGDGSIGNSTNILIKSGGILDVIGRTTNSR